MALNSKIEWTDSTFNPWIGCTKVSPGCDHCYAESFAKRFGMAEWGPGAERKRTSAANWRKPLRWNEQGRVCIDCGTPAIGGDCNCGQIGATGKTRRRRVFCASLADVFDNAVPQKWRNDLWSLIEQTPNLDWLLLTKRIGNVADMAPRSWMTEGFPSNVWLGATVVNQEEADRDIPKLLRIRAAVRFISAEPLLGPVAMKPCWLTLMTLCSDCPSSDDGALIECPSADNNLNWVIVGSESGPNARPCNIEWVRPIKDQCTTAGVAFFWKQHVHQGRKISTPELDGRTWTEFPKVTA